MANYHIHTFGCQMNFHDSENIEAMLVKAGHKKASSINSADIVIFNTCTIREKAYQKATSAIGRLKNKSKKRVIAVCGCVAQQSKKQLITKFPHINIICGPDQIYKLPELIIQAFDDKKSISTEFINDENYPFLNESIPNETGVAYVTVIKGCNCKCAYCIVPSVRGKEVSRKPESIIHEINERLNLDSREIILLGQNVNRYKSDLSFSDLIRKILNETKVQRLRIMSPHPAYFDNDLIELFKDQRLCPHVHLPVQSGSNNVLKKMRRGYTREKFLEIINKLKKIRSNIALGTDIIVGFCDETDEDYNDTINLLKEVEFDSIFAFAYSPRPNTESYSWLDNVPKVIKEERLANLLKTQELISRSRNNLYINKSVDILVLSKDPLKRGLLKGRTNCNKTVIFAGNNSLIGNIVKVRIKEFGTNSLMGELL